MMTRCPLCDARSMLVRVIVHPCLPRYGHPAFHETARKRHRSVFCYNCVLRFQVEHRPIQIVGAA